MSTLIIVAHPDDEVLGCGGTIAKLTKMGEQVNVVIACDGESSRKNVKNIKKLIKERQNQAKDAGKLLGINNISFLNFPDQKLDSISLIELVQKIEKCIVKYKPNKIFTHFSGDLNKDHRLVSEATLIACRPSYDHLITHIYFFETPSSSEWNFDNLSPSFKPNFFIDITKTIKLKIDAIKVYKNEIRKFPHPRSSENINALSITRGSSVLMKNAEAFILVRQLKI